MAVSTKTIRRRIRSIDNTKKITKAIEMVSAAKMRKAINSVLASRPYTLTAWEMVMNLAQRISVAKHPLLEKREEIKKVAIILITSNRGLCSGFNSQIILRTVSFAEKQNENLEKVWIVMGKKGGEFLARRKKNIIAEFEKPDVIASTQEISALTKMVINDYIQGIYDKVFIAYTDFISTLIQKPRIKQLLPFELTKDEELGSIGKLEENTAVLPLENFEYLFEPSPAEVFNLFLPRLIEIQLYQALLESAASEHSARMMAMKNATEAALDMIDELTLLFNQARQAAITKEIAEISGGRAALE